MREPASETVMTFPAGTVGSGPPVTKPPGNAPSSSSEAVREAASAKSEAARPLRGADDDGQDRDAYRVELHNFEGPLDLLLHLIQAHELDILDIPIAFVTERYVAYITLMDEMNIDVASEYLVMAATLAHIKSKMLLPTPPEDQDDGDAESELDPRQELVRRLLEYQKYKDAAERLGGQPVFGRDVYARGSPAPEAQGPAPLAELSVFRLLDAFQSVLDRVEKTLDHQIEFDRLSITERINELVDLMQGKTQCTFDDLFADQKTRAEVIITFLALLEMTRLRMTRLTQEGPLAPIFVEVRLEAVDPGEDAGPIDFQAAPRPVAAGSEESAPGGEEPKLDGEGESEGEADNALDLHAHDPAVGSESESAAAPPAAALGEESASEGEADAAQDPRDPDAGDAGAEAPPASVIPPGAGEATFSAAVEAIPAPDPDPPAPAPDPTPDLDPTPVPDPVPDPDPTPDPAPVPDSDPTLAEPTAAPEPEADGDAGMTPPREDD